jgi:Lon protease-like protein
MDASPWSDLPLFPLNTVLFPDMVLPLHIFEERYKLMINRCLEEERPFGVLLIREGREVGEHAIPHDIGTTSLIAQVEHLEDGKMNIIGIGHERFRLHAIRRDGPYLVGDAEPWPLAGSRAEQARQLVEPVSALLRQYISLLAQAQGHKIRIDELPTQPRALALVAAVVLQLPMPQKQRLLSEPTVTQMILAEWALMRREQLLLDYIIQTQRDQWEGGYSGYLAKN